MKRLVSVILLCVFSQASQAAGLSVVPNAWRLQVYVPDGIVIWFTGSTCSNGVLTLPPNASAADANRLYALIMSAKLAGAKVFISYDSTSPNCPITDYALDAS